MIWKLLRKNISAWQIAGYSVATLIGVVILMIAVQFYRDIAKAVGSDSPEGISLRSARNIVISKRVGMNATLNGEAPVFSEKEIMRIRRQPWAKSVQPFQAADFAVHAGINMGGQEMSTALFFESVPDDVLDINPADWNFDETRPSVPIILSKDYLTLYNFGFAASGRMPVLSEGMIGSVPLSVTLSGNGRQTTLPGRIVGFSSSLNTVAVPQAFMEWAHAQFGDGSRRDPSRLVITLTDEGDPGVGKFMESAGYEVAGADKDLGRTQFFVILLVSVVAAVGLIIVLLALGILVLSIFLLIQKNRSTISGLLLLGYTVGRISRCYILLTCGVNAVVAATACGVLLLARHFWQPALSALGIAGQSPAATCLGGVALLAVVSLGNSLMIRNIVKKCF